MEVQLQVVESLEVDLVGRDWVVGGLERGGVEEGWVVGQVAGDSPGAG